EHLTRYPIVLARDLDVAKAWVRERARGSRRTGLLASSGARRLRPHGITVQERIKEVDWFLRPPNDVRSSSFLELALSEFGIQGLEVDWACLAWGGDLTRSSSVWDIRRFVGTEWKQVQNDSARRYAINRYRVLLTRAREGLAIWVPLGHPEDETRDPQRFNSVAEFLTECGVRSIG
ncbi:MAG: DNA/RNA helicase domain-containing protein, partial [Planctomycetota bacterium]